MLIENVPNDRDDRALLANHADAIGALLAQSGAPGTGIQLNNVNIQLVNIKISLLNSIVATPI